MSKYVREPNEGTILSSPVSYQCSGGRERKVILPSLPDLHHISQRDCNISILVSVSLCVFAVLHLWVKAHAANSWATQKQGGIPIRAFQAIDARDTHLIRELIKIGSTVLFHQSTTQRPLKRSPLSNNKIAKVALISMVSERELLNMNQIVSLVGRSNKNIGNVKTISNDVLSLVE